MCVYIYVYIYIYTFHIYIYIRKHITANLTCLFIVPRRATADDVETFDIIRRNLLLLCETCKEVVLGISFAE